MQNKKYRLVLDFFFRFISAGLFLLFLFTSMAFSSSVQLSALDTIAGFSTTLKSSSPASYGQDYYFKLTGPDGGSLDFPASFDSSGNVKADISGNYTRLAGNYSFSLFANGVASSPMSSFIVFPDSISSNTSKIGPSDQVVRGSSEKALVNVSLKDKYQNPIVGHLVKLIPSDASAVVSPSSALSDGNGEVNFEVSSPEAGVVNYSAYDVSADLLLPSRARVAYFDSSILSFEYAASGSPSGPVDHFNWGGLPATISPGQAFSFTLSAYDASSQLVSGYSSPVSFSVLSGNPSYVTLPGTYTFLPQDLGAHTFSLAMSFQQPGVYEIEVVDLNNPSIVSSYVFDVMGASSSSVDSSAIILTSPIPGTYSNNIQVISGVADPGAKLKIFDNDVELSSLIADINGNFSYTSTTFVDGFHSVYVLSVDDLGQTLANSDAVDFNIDSSSPEISELVISPSGVVAPGEVLNIKLKIFEQLSQASVVFADNIYDLSLSTDGFYVASFAAPNEAGEYPLNFVLVDQLGNQSRFEADKTVVVEGAYGPELLVSSVSNVIATPSDSKVTLTWSAPSVSLNQIKNYRVFYGTSPYELVDAVDTFTNSTTWYISGLDNGIEYYFGIAAVDVVGNMSASFGTVVSAVPGAYVVDVVSPEIDRGLAGSDVLLDMKTDVSNSGPDLWIILLISFFGILAYSYFSFKRVSLD